MFPQVNTTGGAAVTVKVLVQVCEVHFVISSHELVYVQVTSTLPPQTEGGLAGALLVKTPLHPPLAVVDARNAIHAALTAD